MKERIRDVAHKAECINKRHNVDEIYNRLELKNELICKRGLFLAKKRYSNYVIEQEGRKTDEIINMGLEIKRSDFQSYTKECLKELLDII
jgi:DNA polymerase elongation subunit (family B)